MCVDDKDTSDQRMLGYALGFGLLFILVCKNLYSEEDEEDEEDEDEEDEEDEDEEDEEAEEAEEEDEDEELTWDDLEGMDEEELVSVIDDYELDIDEDDYEDDDEHGTQHRRALLCLRSHPRDCMRESTARARVRSSASLK